MLTESTRRNGESSPTRPHWFSYTRTFLGIEDSYRCAISIILEAGAQEFFSGIRVIVVRKEHSESDGVVLEPCLTASLRSDMWRSSKQIYVNYQQAKADHKTSRALSRRLIENSLGPLECLPLCTVVFEMQDTGTDTKPSVGLTIRSHSSSDASLRIVYDHAVAGNTLLVFLMCNQKFRNIDTSIGAENSTYNIAESNNANSHLLRILPVSGSRKSFPDLPFKIIRHIAEEPFRRRNRGWRASLLSCALVCKSWYPLVDMFYDTLGYSIWSDKLNPRAVSNSLEGQPTKGRLIRRLRYQDFKPAPRDSERMQFSEALISVLRMSMFVKEVTLCAIHPTLMPNLLDALRQLERVEILTMCEGDFHCEIKGKPNLPNVIDTQRSIANWTELRVLKVGPSLDRGETQSICETPLKCRLEVLWLTGGNLTGSQLLWFVPPYSKIQNLSLVDIRGLFNSGLLAVLRAISSTLECLTIERSTISREGVDEPYALDQAIPEMTSLHTAYIGGDLFTSLSISAKPKVPGPPSTRFIALYHAPHMDDAERLIEAFETTGWDRIELASDNIVVWGLDMEDRVHRAAEENGIEFTCSEHDDI